LPDDFLPIDATHDRFSDHEGDGRRHPAATFDTISRLESALYMGNTSLRDTVIVSMACSQEVRVPFLDRRLVDVVASLPAAINKRRGKPLKWLLRQACADLIPQALIQRRKTGFNLPIDRWMHGSLRDSCEACVEAAATCGLLDPTGVRELWADFVSSSTRGHWVRPMTLIALGNYLTRIRALA
jgi:asparagine synthase (glutamine-hydrolysing)